MDYKSNIQRFGTKAALEKSKEYIPHMQPGFTISVNEVIEGKNRILNLEKAKTILKESTDLALLHCACRLNHENRCDGTLHACILLNDVAKGFLTEEKSRSPAATRTPNSGQSSGSSYRNSQCRSCTHGVQHQ